MRYLCIAIKIARSVFIFIFFLLLFYFYSYFHFILIFWDVCCDGAPEGEETCEALEAEVAKSQRCTPVHAIPLIVYIHEMFCPFDRRALLLY